VYRGDNVYGFHTDNLGSIQALTDSEGNIAEQYAYDSFGETKIFDDANNEIAESNIGNIFGYTGREFDSENEFYYYRARYYSAKTGRFISEDPII